MFRKILLGLGAVLALALAPEAVAGSNISGPPGGVATTVPCASSVTACASNARLADIEAQTAQTATNTAAALPSGTNAIGALVPTTSGGLSIKSTIVANNTTSIAVDASPGQVYGITAYSISAATPVYIKLYNASQGSTTCGSGTPVDREVVPASGATGSGIILPINLGVAYSTAITLCVTAGFADNDTTAPAASTYIVNILYK